MQELLNFNITGLFYSKNGFEFRKYINIKMINCELSKPDLIVIMMNPGSSSPIEKIDDMETSVKKDSTQRQITKIMQSLNFKFARIINLSDLRQSKSKEFFKELKQMDYNDIKHSIFDISRKEELDQLLEKEVPVLIAWGTNKKLESLALKALEVIKDQKYFGVIKNNCHFGYYHPLPPNEHKQKEWIDTVSKAYKFLK